MIEKKVNLNLLIASDRVSKQNIHPCLKSCIVGCCYIVNMDENDTVRTFLAFTDNLGSILYVIDDNGAKVFDALCDAWGSQTVTISTIGLHRSYTGHRR